MLRRYVFLILSFAAIAAFSVLAAIGCAPSTTPQEASHEASAPASHPQGDAASEHAHKGGVHGGTIVSLGRDSYHVEAIVDKTGAIRLYTLGNDESRVLAIDGQDLTAYVKPKGALDSTSIEVKPQPQPGDESGKSSLFVGQLPGDVIGKSVEITIPSITISGERFRLNFSNEGEEHGNEHMPAAASSNEAQELYLSPGGIYTTADIEENGNMTAEQKFKGFQAKHDLQPMVGDKICPVTLTKANPECSWVIGGKRYEFCCPPCVDEFVVLAKTAPAEIQPPDYYVKRAASSQAEK